MRILMIDDEAKLREKVGKFLALKGHTMLEAGTGEEGLRVLQQSPIDLVLLDLKMPGMNGLTCLREIKATGWQGEVVMISAHGEIKDAVEAMKLGAVDYLTKPFYLEELLLKVQQFAGPPAGSTGIAADSLRKSSGEAQEVVYAEQVGRHSLVYQSEKMRRLMEALERVASFDVPVLLTGETGVGKEVLARKLHERSGRSGQFVAINCGAIPENLLEAELFGYEKGAFSGAHQRKIGKLELAQQGTIFLDEIGELPKGMQVKLLRILQEKEMERLGGTRQIPLDVRVVAATNRLLANEVAVGRFREDLYYRLNVITLAISPLRERREDIIPLAVHFAGAINRQMGQRTNVIGQRAQEKLLSYDFPGNVRELKNIIERSVLLSGDEELEIIFETELVVSTPGREPGGMSDEALTLEELEAIRIRAVLQKHQGNRTRAAEELGISRRTIINKIKQYGLEGE